MTILSTPMWFLNLAFTKQEREIFRLIMALESKSPWHVPINNFKIDPSYGHALDLFIDLKLKCQDVPENMKNLIGAELVEKLLNWKL